MKDEDSRTSSISKAKTIDEIGDFWDTHSLADYWDQTREVHFEVSEVPRNRVTLNLELYSRIKTVAQRRGISPETLVNAWLEERLRQTG